MSIAQLKWWAALRGPAPAWQPDPGHGRGITVKRLWIICFNLILVGLPAAAGAGGGSMAPPDPLIRKVHLANLSGLNYLVAKWYNDNIWLYAIIVTVLMGVMGLLIALVTDVVFRLIGLEGSRMEHHE